MLDPERSQRTYDTRSQLPSHVGAPSTTQLRIDILQRPKMYRRRLNRWGLVKHNKEHEIKAILSKRMERSAIGKTTAFELRGRLVDMADVDRYAGRKPITMRDIMAWRSAGAKTPSGLRCFTPEPLIQCPHPPEVFNTPERLFRDVRIYSIGSFEAGT